MRNWKHSVFSFFLMLAAVSSQIQAAPVPDTGQTTCYDTLGDLIPCPLPGQDLYGQDANYTINPPSYTKLDGNGNALPDSAASWMLVRDNVTGLIWEVKQNKDGVKNYNNPHDADNTYTWYDPNPATNGGYAGTPGDGTDTDDFINALNSAGFGGYSDWRLPGIKELRSICDYGRCNPAVKSDYFPNTVAYDEFYYYWSADTINANLLSFDEPVWTISFYYGYDIPANKVSPGVYSTNWARAVRGEQFANQLKNNGNGTVTDTSTGLMWQQDTARDGQGNYAEMTWEAALDYCESLNLGGFTDWRLPSIKELASIVDLSRSSPAIDVFYFPNTALTTGYYWSSTTIIGGGGLEDRAWLIDFGYTGRNIVWIDKLSTFYIRAVRAGQPGGLPTVATATPTDIGFTSATFGGNVISDGGDEVTERGVCWSVSNNPTTGDDSFPSGFGTGSFTCSISGLTENTTYYVRAYAVNSVGTAYGENCSFKTLSTAPCPDCSGANPVVFDAVFKDGTDCTCTGTESLTIGPNVVIESGARVTFISNKIVIENKFEAKEGALLKMQQLDATIE